ncbi:MAG: hypothetical protein ACOVQX_00785 [Legionella sp.]
MISTTLRIALWKRQHYVVAHCQAYLRRISAAFFEPALSERALSVEKILSQYVNIQIRLLPNNNRLTMKLQYGSLIQWVNRPLMSVN